MDLYVYRAQCVNVVDGDTVDLFVDNGRKQYALERFRLYGINTPELHSNDSLIRAKAVEAKQYITDLLKPTPVSMESWPLIIKTYKSDSFGRWLVDIYFNTVFVNEDLVKSGHAIVFKK